jgi:hypothetical protein
MTRRPKGKRVATPACAPFVLTVTRVMMKME